MVEYVQVIGSDRLRRKTKNQTETTVKVINKGYSSRTAIKLSLYIGRPTKWGNPFPLRKESRRNLVCDQYEALMATRLIKGEITDEDFKEFDGKNLLCFCAPKRCHGDTLVMLYYLTHIERMNWARVLLHSLRSRLEQAESGIEEHFGNILSRVDLNSC